MVGDVRSSVERVPGAAGYIQAYEVDNSSSKLASVCRWPSSLRIQLPESATVFIRIKREQEALTNNAPIQQQQTA